MSALKETAVQMIQELPEEQIRFVIQYIQTLEMKTKETVTSKMKNFLELEKMLIPASQEIDYDKELAEAREEKYGYIN